MDSGIITERLPTGEPRVFSNQVAPRRSLVEQAEKLDKLLHAEVQELENSLVASGFLADEMPWEGTRLPRGDVRLWHAMGVALRIIAEKHDFGGVRERRWLWEAIYNLHASPRIKRAERGRNRNHYEYCYRLGRIPLQIAERIKWSEWVYFFDSTTIRGETRADDWLVGVLSKREKVTRQSFRKFSERLNERIRDLDTSVLSRKELYALYDGAWNAATAETADSPEKPAPS
jgi:hypothetical protein